MIRLAIFEDHPIVLDSMQTIFNDDGRFNLLFCSTTKAALIESLKAQSDIDVFILDLLASDVKGLELFDFLKTTYPSIKVISFTSLSSPVLIENLLHLGVKGYVNKNQPTNDLLDAILAVHLGKISLPRDYSFLTKMPLSSKQNLLTEREVEVILLIFNEFTTNDIAEQLKISVSTVENHRRNIFEKLDVKNVAGLIREATKLGYLS